jgi:PIN domain nuclease of toxin-antitoxin system
VGGRTLIVLDTHAWIWWESDRDLLSSPARKALGRTREYGVSAMSVFEVAMLVERGRLRLDRLPLAWLREALAQSRCSLFPLTPEIAVRAVGLSTALGDPADRLIAATALEHGCPLVTKDARMSDLGGLDVVW